MRVFVRGEGDGCLMQALAGALDDDDTEPCGRCQGCTGWTPDVEVDDDAVAAAREHLRTRDVVLRPRRQWPSGLDEVKGRIAKGRGPLEGRALAGDDGSGWGEVVDRLLTSSRDGAIDEQALAEVLDGLVQVLKRWDWRSRPTAIVPIPSARYGALVRTVAERLGEIGRLPVHPVVDRVDGPSQADMANSPHKAANALRRLRVDGDAATALPPGPVLLLDAVTDSGWTLVAAAHRLTEAGERDVLPLVLSSGP